MRVIAGRYKGKTLVSPPDRTRPTSDRAREGLFSSLDSAFGSMEGLNFLDLFAGSGAVGIEAFSRGAALVHSVEKDAIAWETVTKNFGLLKGADRNFHIYKMSATAFVEMNQSNSYDIIFMDPPYEVPNEIIEKMLADVALNKFLAPNGMIAIERAAKANPFTWPAPFALEKIRSYGQGSIFYGGYSASVLP